MSCIIFENAGEIDIRAIKTFGASSKETENPFGFFGTGLKYAIAILLRHKQSITMHIGEETYAFSTTRAKIRYDYFDIVTMNGEELGFSTDLGKTWELWMAYRELHCNAMDEVGIVYKEQHIPRPQAGKTMAIVCGDEFDSVHESRSLFLLERSTAATVDGMELHHGTSTSIFYRGIKVGELPEEKRSAFTYNITSKLDLSEDRTAKSEWEVRYRIGNAILAMTDKEVIKEIIHSGQESIEGGIDLRSRLTPPTKEFLEVVEAAVIDGEPINDNMVALLRSRKTVAPPTIVLNEVEEKQLVRALIFCNSIGIKADYFRICTVETLGQGIPGMAYDRKIYLSRDAFNKGTKIVAGTLVEEYIHLKFGFRDETRNFQDYLLNMVISLGELNMGEPL